MTELMLCSPEEATHICYKGIVFDDFQIDNEYHSVWVYICEECAKAFSEKGLLSEKEIDYGSPNWGTCSVEGCQNSGEELDSMDVYYADFDINDVEFYKVA